MITEDSFFCLGSVRRSGPVVLSIVVALGQVLTYMAVFFTTEEHGVSRKRRVWAGAFRLDPCVSVVDVL